MIDHLLEVSATGIFNCCNSGTVTPYEIGMAIKNYIKNDLRVEEISYADLLKKLPNKRVNTILSNEKLIATGYEPRRASAALEWCVKNYG
jgi:dTDP-4-dehydrorhamnose reductase